MSLSGGEGLKRGRKGRGRAQRLEAGAELTSGRPQPAKKGWNTY